MAIQSVTAQHNAWVARVLGVQVPGAGVPATGNGQPTSGTVALQKSRLAWDATRKSVLGRLKEMEAAIVADVTRHNEDPDTEDEYDMAEVLGNMPRLYAMMERYDERLIDKLDDALNAEGEERRMLNAEAARIVKQYQDELAKDEELTRIDGSGFAAPLRPVIEKTLTALGQML